MTDLSSSVISTTLPQDDVSFNVEGEHEARQRENLFILLKQAIKARGYTYAKLAAAMNMSELSIKRLFKDKDCKMSRLLEICSIIGLSIDELVNMQKRFNSPPEFLPESTEAALADDKQLFLLFVFLISQIDTEVIRDLLSISKPQLYLYLRELEKLALIELGHNETYRIIVPLPVRWRMGGALSDLIKGLNQRYISHCIDNETHPDYAFTTASRLMTKSSMQKIQSSLHKVREEYDYLSTQDQMFYQANELQLNKLVFGMGPLTVDVILPDD